MGGTSHVRLMVSSLLCIAAAFMLAYFWQYGAPGADKPVLAEASLSENPEDSSLPDGEDAAPPAEAKSDPEDLPVASVQEAAALVVPQPGLARKEENSAGLPPESAASSGGGKALVVGGGPAQADSPQEVGGEARDFSAPYQVKASEPVDDAYFDDALFVGDSITTGIEIYGTMSGAAVVASTGINPSTILSKPAIRDAQGNLHTILETMSGYQPKKIYVLLGANGVGWIAKDSFIGYYEELLGQIEAQHPGALVYVQSIFPVTAEKSLSENGIYANDRIDAYNRALMELCEKKGLPYLNVAEALRGPDGALPAEASTDGIHIIPDYYRKWFDYLKTHTVRPEPEQGKEEKQS